MKFFYLLPLFIGISAAQAGCHLFDIEGEVQVEENRTLLRLGEGTLSDLKLFVPISEQMHTLPLIDQWIKAKIVVNTQTLERDSEISKIHKVELAPRDPLNDVPQETRKYKGETPCR